MRLICWWVIALCLCCASCKQFESRKSINTLDSKPFDIKEIPPPHTDKIKGKRIYQDSVEKPLIKELPKVLPKVKAHSNRKKLGEPVVTPFSQKVETFIPGKDGVPEPRTFKVSKTVTKAKSPKPKMTFTGALGENAVADITKYESDLDKNLYGTEYSGLTSYGIEDLMMDRRGNLWMATDGDGILKYDGTYLTQYRESEGLNDARTTAILEDKKGNIWILNYWGILSRFDGLSFTDYDLTEEAKGEGMLLGRTDMIEDSEGNIWFAGFGAYKFNPETEIIEEYSTEQGLIYFDEVSTELVYGFFEDHENTVWMRTYRGFIKYNYVRGEKFGKLTRYENVAGLNINEIRSIYQDKKGDVWFSGRGGVTRFDGEDFFHYSVEQGFDSESFILVREDDNGNIWFGSSGAGLYKYNGKILEQFSKSEGLSDNKVKDALFDGNGNLWVATEPSGLSKIKLNGFRHASAKNGLRNDAVKSIAEDKEGEMWLGIHSFENYGFGLNRYDGEYYTYYDPNGVGVQDGNIYDIITDKEGDIWYLDAGYLSQLDKKKNVSTHFTIESGLSSNGGWAINQDHKGRILVGESDGLSIYHPKRALGKGYFTHFTKKQGLNSHVTTTIEEDSSYAIWFGAWQTAMIKLEIDEESDSAKVSYFTQEQGLQSTKFLSSMIDSKGRLWIGTEGGGAHVFDGASFKQISSKDGLINSNVSSIIEDREGRIWLATERGLGMLVPSQVDDIIESVQSLPGYQIHYFKKEDGLKNVNFTINSAFLDSKNTLWWGTEGGWVSLDLNTFKVPDSAPTAVELAYLEVNESYVDFSQVNDSAYQSDLAFGDKLSSSFNSKARPNNHPLEPSFPYDLNHLTFHFSSIDWEAPHKIYYSYRLKGLENEWSVPSKEPKADYRNLSHGNFTFEVKAYGAAQKWSESFNYSFTITPPWWYNTWAYILYVLLFISAVWAFINWRTRQSRMKLEEAEKLNVRLQQVDSLKDQFLANTSHELRTPLHGMVGIAEALFDQIEGVDEKENLSMLVASGKRLSSLVNDLLDFSKVKNHDLQLAQKSISIYPVVDLVFKTSQPLLGTKPIELINEVPKDIALVYADENRLQQIFYNLIGNAIKFTEKGEICVGIENESEEVFEIFVKDSGIGILKEKQELIFKAFEQEDGSVAREFGGTGLGLSITRQLVELHGGEIRVESMLAQGAKFIFSLPKADEKSIDAIIQKIEIPIRSASLFQAARFKPKADMTAVITPSNSTDDIRILLIDDEPINHQVIKNYLRGNQIFLQSVMSGHEALEVIQKEPRFDLILLDIMMPRMNGYEVCAEIRKQFLASEMPVIMLTAKSQIADLVQGLESGANDYISKPFSKDEFLARIKTHVNLHKIHSATHKFVPKDFLKSIDRDNITEVRLGDQKAREVTVFFSDIRSYTSLSESMSPEENFKFVNAYAGRMGPIIRQNEGFVNQYLGDGIMAIFQHAPEDSLKAAIEMQWEIESYNRSRKKHDRIPISVGMGMHFGSLIMGVIGDALRNDSATIADTVNTAARMEGLTKHFGARIILSETVYQTLPQNHTYHLKYLGLVQVKGKAQPLGVYECLNAYQGNELEEKLQTLDTFNQGMQHYFSKNFDQAMLAFKEVLALHPQDKSAQLYLSRCSSLRLVGVADDWTGIEMMSSK